MRNETLKKTVLRTMTFMMIVAAVVGFTAQSTFACDYEPEFTPISSYERDYYLNNGDEVSEYDLIDCTWAPCDPEFSDTFLYFYETDNEMSYSIDSPTENEFNWAKLYVNHGLISCVCDEYVNGHEYFYRPDSDTLIDANTSQVFYRYNDEREAYSDYNNEYCYYENYTINNYNYCTFNY